VPPRILTASAEPAALLPDRFQQWFAARGWSPRAHQLALLEKAREDRSALLIAPTGAGKTLAGFLPTLVELSSAAEVFAKRSPQPQSQPPSLRGRLTPEGRRERGEPQAPEDVA
jgi:ATP-dependent helicase Lhr and Lhr-like helicase